MIRLFFLLLGFGLSVIGFMHMILYLNLLTMGYSWYDYLVYIIKRIECLQGLIGFIIIIIVIFYKGGNNDIHI